MRATITATVLLIFSSVIFGKPRNFDLVNKKTNQWLSFSMSLLGKNGYHKFYLITKSLNYNNKCDVKEFRVSNSRNINYFLDSLQREGWTSRIKFYSTQKRYTPTIELNSISFLKMNNEDSLFQFSYKIWLFDTKKKISVTQLDTLVGTERKHVTNAFLTNDYKFNDIIIQKGTGIILVRLYSDGLLKTFKKEHYHPVFELSAPYYF